MRFDDAKSFLIENMQERTMELRQRFAIARTSLQASSPLAVLQRGFSVVSVERNGQASSVVRRAEDVKAGERLVIRPLHGLFTAVAEKTKIGDTGR
jgi:exonuclease VII large subunit